MTATFTFEVSPETMATAKANRLKFFEQQIAESQINVRIYEANVVAYGLASDITALANEVAKLERLTLNYDTVSSLEE